VPRGVKVLAACLAGAVGAGSAGVSVAMLTATAARPIPAQPVSGTVYLLTPAGRGPVLGKFKDKVDVIDGWTVWRTPTGEVCRTRAAVLVEAQNAR
jgi:hypothetical protein